MKNVNVSEFVVYFALLAVGAVIMAMTALFTIGSGVSHTFLMSGAIAGTISLMGIVSTFGFMRMLSDGIAEIVWGLFFIFTASFVAYGASLVTPILMEIPKPIFYLAGPVSFFGGHLIWWSKIGKNHGLKLMLTILQ